MKNSYCDLPQKEINALPDRFLGYLLSPFQYNLKNEFILVPEDTFKEMIDIITEYALIKKAEQDAARAAEQTSE